MGFHPLSRVAGEGQAANTDGRPGEREKIGDKNA